MSALAVLCLLLWLPGAFGFGIGFGLFKGNKETQKHEEITETAILNVTVQVCRTLALAAGKDFSFPPQPFTTKTVAAACQASKSSKSYRQAVKLIKKKNWRVDVRHVFNAQYHFDNEMFLEGRKIIKEGLEAIKASNKEVKFEAAREKLGEILHPLQDFYSHSNWIEMGNKLPNSNMIRPGTSIGNIAAKSRATCRNCGGNCRNNILQDIIDEKILTSGYFSFLPKKPKGKCSHGGFFDLSRFRSPRGGINKDKPSAEHGHLHTQAADMAIAATSELLDNIRQAAGDRTFLQMMGLSSKALCFVIDTTGSMTDDIEAVKTVTSSIINDKVGTEDEPSLYVLVPFNDPGFGPLMKTTDPEVFKNAINSLSATGGGDFAEMSLSGLLLALTGAPPNSEIFLFTDAPAKDNHLQRTVRAIIERTKTVVNFMITNVLRRRRQIETGDDQPHSRMVTSQAQVYQDLAQRSGGQYIEVTKPELPSAISIVTESTSSLLVTLRQAARGPGVAGNFTFTVDDSLKNLTIYITGRRVSFTLIGPSGVTQQSGDTTGPLTTESHSVGNFRTLLLNQQVGLWEIRMTSPNPYTLKVVGESPIDFLFDFLEVSQGPLGGFDVVDNRPRAGVNGTLLVTLTGSDSATVTEVTLVESSGSGEVNGSVEALDEETFLARFDRIPSKEFVVVVKGQNSKSSSKLPSTSFQRQSSTTIEASALSVTADDSNSILVPGTLLSVPFSVMTDGAGGTFLIQATNDRGFTSTFPTALVLDDGGNANGTVNLTAPLNTTSGTDVTLTIEAEAPGGEDINFVVLRFTVLEAVTDFTQPMCVLISLDSNCSESCSSSTWELSVQVTDSGGTGVDRVSLKLGNGTMNISPVTAGNENVTLVSYNASCCSPDVELLVVDQVGNVGSCFYTVRKQAPDSSTTQQPSQQPMQTPIVVAVTSLSTKAVQSLLLCLIIMILGLTLPFEMGIN